MVDWISQYTAALDVRDQREGAHKTYIDAYTRLADRTASVEKAISTPSEQEQGALAPPKSGPETTAKGKQRPTEDPRSDLLARLRLDLSSTQRLRTELQSQLTRLQSELSAAQVQCTASGQRITGLERDKRDMERRLRDRDEELRGKSRLVENVQDEMVGLNLQLNMAEQRTEKLRGENEELVRRWMARMGEEAERMNAESKWA